MIGQTWSFYSAQKVYRNPRVDHLQNIASSRTVSQDKVLSFLVSGLSWSRSNELSANVPTLSGKYSESQKLSRPFPTRNCPASFLAFVVEWELSRRIMFVMLKSKHAACLLCRKAAIPCHVIFIVACCLGD